MYGSSSSGTGVSEVSGDEVDADAFSFLANEQVFLMNLPKLVDRLPDGPDSWSCEFSDCILIDDCADVLCKESDTHLEGEKGTDGEENWELLSRCW